MRLVAAAPLAALFLLALPGTVLAQSRAAIAPADDVEAAKAHFAAGLAYYEQANYTDAVKEFTEAYRLSQRTDLLYNIALCYERLNQYDQAIETLQKYLTDKPNAPDRVTIESRIHNLEKQRDQLVPAPPPAPSTVTSRGAGRAPPPSGERPRLWWVPGTALLAAGGAMLIASIGTGVEAKLVRDDLTTRCDLSLVCPPSERDRVDLGRRLAISTDVLIGVGAATAVVGAIVLGVQSRRPQLANARVKPAASGVQVRF